MRTRRWSTACVGLACVAALAGMTQPEPGGGSVGSKDATAAETEARPLLRARLERRLSEAEREAARLREAIEAVDRGESPREVWQGLRPAGAEQMVRRGVRPGARGEEDRVRGLRGESPEGVPPEGGPREWPPGSPESVRAFVRERLPRLDAALAEMDEREPGAGRFLIERLGPRLQELMAAYAEDPELAERKLAELQSSLDVLDAADRVRRAGAGASEEALAGLRAELETALRRQFDARAARTELEIARLRDRLARLESERDERVADREEEVRLVAERMMRRAIGGEMRPARDGPGRDSAGRDGASRDGAGGAAPEPRPSRDGG